MKKKVLLSAMLTLIIGLSGALMLTGCGKTCKHENIAHVDAVASTCMTTGNIEYWHCEDCGNYYSDSEYKTKIKEKDVVIAIDPENHDYETVYDYENFKYLKTCKHNSEHTAEEEAGSKDYPYLANSVSTLNVLLSKGGYIKLEKDLTAEYTLSANKDTVIDLNGKTLSGSASIILNVGNSRASNVTLINGTIKNTASQGFTLNIGAGSNVTIKNSAVESQYMAIYSLNSNVSLNNTNVKGSYGVYTLGSVSMDGGSITATNRGILQTPKPYTFEDVPAYYPQLTITDATINSSNVGVEIHATKATVSNTNITAGASCMLMFRSAELEMNNCELVSEKGSGLQGNGTIDKTISDCGIDTIATLNNCTINAAAGIYMPQTGGKLTVNGGSITASAVGIEVRAGSATLNNVSVECTADSFAGEPNDDGTTIKHGVAVAVSQHTTNDKIVLTLNNCNLKGVYALYEKDFMDDVQPKDITITLVGENVLNGGVYSEDCDNIANVEPPSQGVA